jgi:tripartite-type tricarboxylate transporter receptor subunit TctC
MVPTHGHRTRLSTALLLLVIPFAAVLSASAQTAPPKGTITLIVPFAAGGSTDAIARVVAEGMRQSLGQPVVVENRAGAGGSLGTAAIARAAPDGLTVGMGTASTLAINPAVYRNLPFEVLTDLVPVGGIAAVSNILSVHPGVPAQNMAGFVALARQQPGQLGYASPGHGSVGHLLGEQFKLATGTDLLHVPYRGMGPALTDAVAGQVQAIFDNLPTSLTLVQGGKLRALGVSGSARSPALPDVPTFGEIGLQDINWGGFFGLVAPKGTPPAIVARLHAALRDALALPSVRERLAAQQATIAESGPEAFRTQIARELDRMRRATAAAKIELQ